MLILTGIRYQDSLFFHLLQILFFADRRTLKNETPVHDRVTPENIRSEVIQTTCSARKQLTLAFASSSESEAFKNEQNLFIQSSVKKNSTVPRGRQAASIGKKKQELAERICFFIFFLF